MKTLDQSTTTTAVSEAAMLMDIATHCMDHAVMPIAVSMLPGYALVQVELDIRQFVRAANTLGAAVVRVTCRPLESKMFHLTAEGSTQPGTRVKITQVVTEHDDDYDSLALAALYDEVVTLAQLAEIANES
jgi:hypothetical protein